LSSTMRHCTLIVFVFLSTAPVFAQQVGDNPTVLKVCGPNNPAPCADKAPRPIYSPDPELPKAHKKKDQGTVVLSVVVGVDGKTADIAVNHSDNQKLDKNAIDAVKQWKFIPGSTNGTPCPVQFEVRVSFRFM